MRECYDGDKQMDTRTKLKTVIFIKPFARENTNNIQLNVAAYSYT